MTPRARGIPGLRADQQQAMATRHGSGRSTKGGSMAGRTATSSGMMIAANGDVIDKATGEIIERGTPEPEPNEAEVAVRELANRDAEADPEMLDLLNHVAVAWRPEVGDKLIGEVVGRYTRDDGQWGPYEIVEVRTASGAVIAWHAFGTVGKSSIARRNPEVGDRIGITALGKVPTDKGNPYMNYQVVVRKAPRDGTMFPTGNSGGTAVQ